MIRHPTIPIFAQAEEDIIIHGVLQSLGMPTDTGTFIEIGVGDGRENNTRSLAARGWTGQWIGNVPIGIQPERVSFYFCQVELDNLQTLPINYDAPVDLFSIDIDGNDYWILERLLEQFIALPRILVVEYNSNWPDDVAKVMPYTPHYRWAPGAPHGASLQAWLDLLTPMGYALVETSAAKVNAFFVRS